MVHRGGDYDENSHRLTGKFEPTYAAGARTSVRSKLEKEPAWKYADTRRDYASCCGLKSALRQLRSGAWFCSAKAPEMFFGMDEEVIESDGESAVTNFIQRIAMEQLELIISIHDNQIPGL